jgi:hypothetical protein
MIARFVLHFSISSVFGFSSHMQDYAVHAGHSGIEVSDVKLAVESKAKKYQPPTRQDLITIAKRKNQVRPARCGWIWFPFWFHFVFLEIGWVLLSVGFGFGYLGCGFGFGFGFSFCLFWFRI